MRRFLLSLLFVGMSLPAAGEDLLDPAAYMAILTESKIRYNLLSEPSKNATPRLECPRRDATTRVVAKGAEKSLVEWKVKPEAVKLLEEGEALFQQQQYAEAGEKYKAAIEADPNAPVAYFNYGDTLLFGAKDAAGALAQYEKGIALDPTLPLGHFFASTALRHLGRVDEARARIVEALVYHPPYELVWQALAKAPERFGIKPVVRHEFKPPAGVIGKKTRNGVDIFIGTDGEWLGYATCKAVWANERRFEKSRSKDGGWSLEEERACVLNHLMARHNAASAALEEAKQPATEEAVMARLAPRDRHLFEVAQAKLLDGYILFEVIGQSCPLAMSLLEDHGVQQVRDYIRRFVIVPAR